MILYIINSNNKLLKTSPMGNHSSGFTVDVLCHSVGVRFWGDHVTGGTLRSPPAAIYDPFRVKIM